jgi:hypothetical protein
MNSACPLSLCFSKPLLCFRCPNFDSFLSQACLAPLSSPITRIRLPSPGEGAGEPGTISWSDELSPRDPTTAAATTKTTVSSTMTGPGEELGTVSDASSPSKNTDTAGSGGRTIEGAQHELAAAGVSRWGASGGASQSRRGASMPSSGGVLRTLEAANVLQTDVAELRRIIEGLAAEIRRCEGAVAGGELRLEC